MIGLIAHVQIIGWNINSTKKFAPSADITALVADLLADLIIGTSISNFHYRSR